MIKKRFVLFCVIAFLLILPFITYFLRKQQRTMPENSDYVQAEKFVQTHIGRIDEQIKMLQKEDIKESFARLIEDQQYSYPGYHTDVKGAARDLETLLSSRRFLKVFQQFQTLPQNQIDIYLKDFFEQAIDDFKVAVSSMLSQYDNSLSAQRKISLMGAKYKICTIMLLAANKGDTQKVVDMFTSMNDTIKKTIEHINTKKDLFPQGFSDIIKSIMTLDQDCIMSVVIYAFTINKPNSETIDYLKGKLVEKKIPLMKWDAQDTYYDVLYRQGYATIDKSTIFQNFNVYYVSKKDKDNTETYETTIDMIMSELKNKI
jgi:hypothetical protein